MIRKIRNAIVAIAIAAMMIAPLIGKSSATASPAPTPAFADADLSAENRALGSFVDDLHNFDKKGAELGRKPLLSRTEFAAYERQGEDLKRRVPGLQNTLRQIIDKLKAAGQWDNLDQTLLQKINDSDFQSFVRNEGFKKTLEEIVSGRNVNVNEVLNPVELLRKKVAQDSSFKLDGSPLASRAVRVSYTTAPAMYNGTLRCRLSQLRRGISGAVSKDGKASPAAAEAFRCACGLTCGSAT